jgi:hypothetical protein
VQNAVPPTVIPPVIRPENVPVVTNINDSDGDGVPNNTDYYPNAKSEVIVKKYSFNYKMLGDSHGQEVNFTIEIPKDLYLFYLNQNHTFTDNYENITTFITKDDIVIKSIIDKIKTLHKEKGLNPIALIYQLSGEITWTDDKFSITGWDEYPKYPIETLIDGKGDCEDTVFLMAALYKAFGVEPMLVRFDDHLGLATVVDQEILDKFVYKHGKDFMADINSELTKNKLIYLETTSNTNTDFGFMPEQLQGKNYTIHALGEYKRTNGTQIIEPTNDAVTVQYPTNFKIKKTNAYVTVSWQNNPDLNWKYFLNTRKYSNYQEYPKINGRQDAWVYTAKSSIKFKRTSKRNGKKYYLHVYAMGNNGYSLPASIQVKF